MTIPISFTKEGFYWGCQATRR